MLRNKRGQFEKELKHPVKEYRREYQCWKNMIRRCYEPECDHFIYYGGRGILVCDRWLESVDNFIDDMGKCPDGFSLDRIDLNGNYCPENCRWAGAITQANNKKNNRYFEYEGELLTIPELARRNGIKRSTLSMRIYGYGWEVQRAVETPVRAKEDSLSQ